MQSDVYSLQAPQHQCMQAMEFFIKALVTASAAIERGVDPSKAAAASGGADAAAAAAAGNVSSFLGWAMSSISLATASSLSTPSATPQKPPLLPGSATQVTPGGGATTATNGASARRNLSATEGWDDDGAMLDGIDSGGVGGGAAAGAAMQASGRLASVVDTSSLDKLAGACACTPASSLPRHDDCSLATLRGLLLHLTQVQQKEDKMTGRASPCAFPARIDMHDACAGDAWADDDGWGDLDVPTAAAVPAAQRSTPAKAKPRLSVPRKSGGKGD